MTIAQALMRPRILRRLIWVYAICKCSIFGITSFDKSLSRNHHRVLGPTRWPAIKEESKVVNRDWVDHQACSLSQAIH